MSVPLLTACPIYPEPYPPPPPPPDFSYKGAWLGTLKDSRGGEGALTLTFIYQTDYTLGGSWQADFGSDGTRGVFEGVADFYGNSVSALLFLEEFPSCALEIKGAKDGNTLVGTYRAASIQPEGCTTAAFSLGTFTVTKQTPVE